MLNFVHVCSGIIFVFIFVFSRWHTTRLFHVGWPVGPRTSPGKIIPSLNLNMHMCSTCTGQNYNHKWNMGIFRAGSQDFQREGA